MKVTFFVLVIWIVTFFAANGQSITLLQSDTTVQPLYSGANLLRLDTLRFRLHISGAAPTTGMTVNLAFDSASMASWTNKPSLVVNSIQVSRNRWLAAGTGTNTIDTFLLLRVPATMDTLKKDEVGRLYITTDPSAYLQVRFAAFKSIESKSKITLHVPGSQPSIIPFVDPDQTPQIDTINITVSFSGKYPADPVVHFYLDTPYLLGRPLIKNPNIYIDSTAWMRGSLDVTVLILSNPIIDTGTFHPSYGLLKIREDTLNSIAICQTYKSKRTWARKSNFFIGSFIKSISGSVAQSELLDIFVKVNLTSAERLIDSSTGYFFGFFGADAGLSTDTVGKNGLPLNEAVVSVNYAPKFLMGKHGVTTQTNRIGYFGGGLKVFYSQAYLGFHIGVTEVSGFLKHSYLQVGFYHSPWLSTLSGSNAVVDSTKLPYYHFRNNIYFEAAFNSFGDNAPKALQFIRLKFGLMLPVRSHDYYAPTNKDFIYRLAVEVPIGGPLKF